MPIIDITNLRARLKFHTGNGLTRKRGVLGNALQTPRLLTEDDLALPETAIRKKKAKVPRARRKPITFEALEGRRLLKELAIYQRDPALALTCLKRDTYKCRCCRFAVDPKRFPRLAAQLGRILHVHHVRPVSTGQRVSKLEDLVTLCPTCHAIAHGIATATNSKVVSLSLLKKFYRPE